jgi:hypothetical protein
LRAESVTGTYQHDVQSQSDSQEYRNRLEKSKIDPFEWQSQPKQSGSNIECLVFEISVIQIIMVYTDQNVDVKCSITKQSFRNSALRIRKAEQEVAYDGIV